MGYGVCKAMADRAPEAGDPQVLIANPECICPTAMAAMICATGHMLECHYSLNCKDAECDHYKRALDDEGYVNQEVADVP